VEGKAIQWHWVPCVSVGPIIFGEPVAPVIGKFDLQKLEKDYEDADWDTYEFPDCETRIYVDENGGIKEIGCFDNLYYQGQNLFGLTLDEIRVLLGPEDEIGKIVLFDFPGNEFEKFPVEFENFSAQFWFREGVVESVMIGPCYDDDDQ
jgi:hypothetical protein